MIRMNPEFLAQSEQPASEPKRERLSRELEEVHAGQQECIKWLTENEADISPEAEEKRLRHLHTMMDLEKREEELLMAKENIL